MSNAADAPQIKSTSLYVGDLHPLVSDALLFTKFSELGPVVNARVCRDMASRESLGYGYVNFRDPKDAEQALECMNYGVFFGRPFRLMWSQKDPSLRKSGKGNIFIKNLDKSITPSELYDTFEQFGKILSCKLAMDDKGVSKGFGFVHFETEESAQKAVSYVNGKNIRNRVLYVGPFISKTDRKCPGGASKFNNCYVKNFGEDMDDDRFRKMFEKYGEIKSACVMKTEQGVSKGFGFVCFEEPSSAEAAVKEMNNLEMNGKQMYVGRAQRKEERQEELKARFEKQRTERQSRYASGVNLYVKNLDDTIDDEKLREAFTKFGDISSAKVMRDANGLSRCFGFVCFRSAEHATLAVTNTNTVILGSKPLYVAIAQRKDDRRAKLTADYHARMEQMRNSMYPMHPTLPFMATAPASAGYQTNRGFYQRQHGSSGPRWNPAIVPNTNLQLASAQQYQTQSANPQAYAQLMRLNTNPGAAMTTRMVGAPNAAMNAQMNQMAQFSRQGQQTRQMNNPAMNAVAATAIQNRVNMPMSGPAQNVQTMGNRPGPQMAQMSQASMQNRAPHQMRTGTMPSANQIVQEDKDSQRSILGNRLYDYVEKRYPQQAAKITGMLLSMNINEVTTLFDDPKELEEAILKAYTMLQNKNESAAAAAGEDKSKTK